MIFAAIQQPRGCWRNQHVQMGLSKTEAVSMFKAFFLGALLTGTIAIVIGSQGSSGGPLAIHSMAMGDHKIFWSWPLFLSGSGLAWALILLQK